MASLVLSCGVLVMNRQRELLMGHATGTPRWDIPKGVGEPDETPLQTAVREAREETGLDIVVGELIGLYSSDGETVVLAVYEATSAVGELRAGDDLTEVQWFSVSKLPELAFPRDQRIMDAWLSAREKARRLDG